MEPYQKKIIHPALSSFIYKQDFMEAGNDWHFHPEIEIQMPQTVDRIWLDGIPFAIR